MTGDVTVGASVISRLGEGAAAIGAARCSEAKVSVSSSAGAAGLGVHDHAAALETHECTILRDSVPSGST